MSKLADDLSWADFPSSDLMLIIFLTCLRQITYASNCKWMRAERAIQPRP